MKTRLPTLQEIDELVSFLPRLYAEGFRPVSNWRGGNRGSDDARTLPWPEYQEIVTEFFRVAAKECWSDYDYRPDDAGRLLMNEATVRAADLEQVKTMLTYCVRGERFSDGHWAAMIDGGHVRRLLERLAELRGAA
jgi:hypothetical protein